MTGRRSVQEVHVRVDSIRDGVVRLVDGQVRAVLEVSSVSLGMQGDTGQEALLAGYAGYLNSLAYPVQTLVRVLPVDIDCYLTRLDRRARHDLPPTLADVAQDTAAYLRRKARQRTLLDCQFYVVVPADTPGLRRRWCPFGRATADRLEQEAADTAAKQLSFRCEEIARQLARCGLTARRLSDAELLDLFHACFCPDSVGLERARLEHAGEAALVVTGQHTVRAAAALAQMASDGHRPNCCAG